MWDRHTIRRKMNSLSRRAQWTWAPALPIRAWIVATSRCNLRCRTCPTHHPADPRGPEHFEDMRPQIYERLRRGLLPALQEVYLSGGGEPFLAPIFYRMLDDMLDADKRVLVVTNGTIIRPDYLERLVRAPSQIRVSLDGTTPEVMDHMRPGARLDRVLEFMKTVKEIMDRSKHPAFEFQLSFVVTRSNVEQMTDCVELAHRYGVRTVAFGNFTIDGRTDEFARESLIQRPDVVLPHWERAYKRGLELGVLVPPTLVFLGNEGSGKDIDQQRPDLCNSSGRIKHCPIPWWYTYIEVDGTVKPCCAFLEGGHLGNLREQSFREIWNGPKYRELRRTVNTPDMPAICKHCTIPMRI